MIKKIKRKYTDQTLHQKVRLSILLFSLLPLLCLACISLPLIYKNQVGKIQEEVYEELQNRADDMNYEMNTIELMAKTVWSLSLIHIFILQRPHIPDLSRINIIDIILRKGNCLKVRITTAASPDGLILQGISNS